MQEVWLKVPNEKVPERISSPLHGIPYTYIGLLYHAGDKTSIVPKKEKREEGLIGSWVSFWNSSDILWNALLGSLTKEIFWVFNFSFYM